MNFFIISLIKAGVVAFVLLTTLAYLQWIERKVIAHIQLRVGPRRVGPHGLLQPLADVIKLITKEDILPSHVNTVFYFLAPFIAVVFALISISVIPFGPEITVGGVKTSMQLTDLNIGVLFIPGSFGDRRLWRRARRVGVEQQIFPARRPAQLGADDQL